MHDDRGALGGAPDDLFFADTLAELEGQELRKYLEHKGYIAAELQIDFERQGAMYRYARSRRIEAAEAMRMLVDSDPRDAVRIAQMQAQVQEYLRIVIHVRAIEQEAVEADKQIREQFGDDHDTDE